MAVSVRTAGVIPTGTAVGAFPAHAVTRGADASTSTGTPVEVVVAGDEVATFTTLTPGVQYALVTDVAVPPRAQQLKRRFSDAAWDSNPGTTELIKRTIVFTGA
jgi:hypothetical protein